MINPLRTDKLVRVVVGVDPATTAGEDSDDSGIVIAGVGKDGDGYILDDLTCHLSPDGWAREVVRGYDKWGADRIICEVNNGGALVETVLRTVDSSLPIKAVHASRGKLIRAEPIAALFEQGRVHMVGEFPELEDECSTWIPGDPSPDRMDAMVWALSELMLGGMSVSAPVFTYGPSRWAPVRQRAGGYGPAGY